MEMHMVQISNEDRYFSLVGLHVGEALTEMNNLRLRGAVPGSDMASAKRSLMHAMAALDGQLWTAPVDPQHISKGK
jgi:hypothetical protein